MSLDPFRPIPVAKELIGNLTDSIKETDRDLSVPLPENPRATFNTALLLQAGLRALLLVEEREGIAEPKIFDRDPEFLQKAQTNFLEVLRSGKNATDEQRESALESVDLAAKQLFEQGYKKLAVNVSQFVSEQKPAVRPAPPGGAGAQPKAAEL